MQFVRTELDGLQLYRGIYFLLFGFLSLQYHCEHTKIVHQCNGNPHPSPKKGTDRPALAGEIEAVDIPNDIRQL